MRRGFWRAILLAAGLSLLAACGGGGGSGAAPADPADLVVNGSFEEPDVPAGISVFPADAWNLPGWTFVNEYPIAIGDNLAVSPEEVWQAYGGDGGDQFAILDAAGNGGIRQDIRTVPGASYFLRVAYRPKPGAAVDTCVVRLYRDEEMIGYLPVPYSTFPSWVLHFFRFTASGAATTIKLVAAGEGDGNGGFIDYVDVIPYD